MYPTKSLTFSRGPKGCHVSFSSSSNVVSEFPARDVWDRTIRRWADLNETQANWRQVGSGVLEVASFPPLMTWHPLKQANKRIFRVASLTPPPPHHATVVGKSLVSEITIFTVVCLFVVGIFASGRFRSPMFFFTIYCIFYSGTQWGR